MNNKNLERFAISMEEFVYNYLGLDYLEGSETFEKLKHCTHQDLTELGIEGIARVPFDSVTLSDLMNGNILIVKSGNKKREYAPYIRPSLVLNGEKKIK